MIAAVAAAALLAAPVRSQPLVSQALWSRRDQSIWAVSCVGGGDVDADCTALEARRGAERLRLGQGYLPPRVGAVKVLWRRPSGASGPDVIVLGDPGGSGGCVDLFAVSFSTATIHSQKLAPCHDDAVSVQTRGGRPVLDIVFDFSFFRGGSHASAATIPVPVLWDRGRFRLDLASVKARTFGSEDEALRRAAVYWSLSQSATEKGEVLGDALQPAVQALAGLMLYGHADRARKLLNDLWPKLIVDVPHLTFELAKGRDAFWGELCAAMVRDSLWSELGLHRLPHADLIEAGARAAAPR